MSIVISNISDEYSREGIQQYEVCLNRIQLCTFTHLSEDGMAVCLVKAAKALADVAIDEKIAEYKICHQRMLDLISNLDFANVGDCS